MQQTQPWRKTLVAAIGWLAIVVSSAVGQVTPNPYPNEIKWLRFYVRYLAPLRPHVSNDDQVAQVLRSDRVLRIPSPALTAPEMIACTRSRSRRSMGCLYVI
jgi:hypothetical protein